MHVSISLIPRKHNQVHNILIMLTSKSIHSHNIDPIFNTWIILVKLVCLSVEENMNEIDFFLLFQK